MTQTWQVTFVRALLHVLALGAFALVVFVTVFPAHAQTLRVADVMPLAVPADLVAVRAQPAMGPTLEPLAPGQQALTPQLLANYVERQKALRAFDVEAAEPGALNTEVLLGYIARASLGGSPSFGSNGALSAINSFAPPQTTTGPSLDATMLSAYVQKGYEPTAERVETANTERGCLAQAIYHEARGESEAGQMAVANVIVNRAMSGKFPPTLCGVIYQNANKGRYRCQFTFACDGRDDAPGERRAWARSAALAEAVYAEYATGEKISSLPRTALYYHTTAVRPSWSNTYDQVAQIGSHIFYAPN